MPPARPDSLAPRSGERVGVRGAGLARDARAQQGALAGDGAGPGPAHRPVGAGLHDRLPGLRVAGHVAAGPGEGDRRARPGRVVPAHGRRRARRRHDQRRRAVRAAGRRCARCSTDCARGGSRARPRLRHPLLQRLSAGDAASASTRRLLALLDAIIPEPYVDRLPQGTRLARLGQPAARAAVRRAGARATRRTSTRPSTATRKRMQAAVDGGRVWMIGIPGARRHGGGRGAVREPRARPYESVVAQVESAAWPTRTSASVPSANARTRRSAARCACGALLAGVDFSLKAEAPAAAVPAGVSDGAAAASTPPATAAGPRRTPRDAPRGHPPALRPPAGRRRDDRLPASGLRAAESAGPRALRLLQPPVARGSRRRGDRRRAAAARRAARRLSRRRRVSGHGRRSRHPARRRRGAPASAASRSSIAAASRPTSSCSHPRALGRRHRRARARARRVRRRRVRAARIRSGRHAARTLLRAGPLPQVRPAPHREGDRRRAHRHPRAPASCIAT